MQNIDLRGLSVSAWLVIPLTYFLWVTLLLFAKRIGFSIIRKFTQRTSNQIDDLIIKSLDFPLTLLIFASGGLVIEQMIPAGGSIGLTNYFLVAFKAATIVAIILFADSMSNGLMKEYADRIEIIRQSGGIARGCLRLIVIGLGVLILLDSFGVSITPVIASLGIGSLAVALALQPTLENLFSGVQLIIDKPIQVGHFIKLESGEEGFVHRIGWRSSWIHMLPNNMVVIPNKNLVNSRVINYHYPNKELAVTVEVGVHYESDLEHVERVTIEVARETLKEVPGGVPEFAPFIRFHTFNEHSVDFSVMMRGKQFIDSYLIKHEFIKRLHKRFSEEGICMPYPINYRPEKASAEAVSRRAAI